MLLVRAWMRGDELVARVRWTVAPQSDRCAEVVVGPGQVEAAAVVSAEPLREMAHRVLIDARTGAGKRGAALRQFVTCRVLLAGELGLEPGAAVVAAVERARLG